MLPKTYEEINEKIKNKKAVVLTAEEVIKLVEEKGLKEAAKEVDVVTTATFGPMCSSGAFLNIGHTKPKMKVTKAWINGVNAYAGLAAVDLYIGATEIPENDPANSKFPGDFSYGGGHVIQDLIAGKDVELKATAYGTDCYPRKELHTKINIKDLNEAILVNPRNCYQNYNVAVNKTSKRKIYTYMGVLKPNIANANYCSAGQLSPLLKDPYYKTIGVGTRVWVGGAQGYVYWWGTQHSPNCERKNGVPVGGAGTLAIVGDLKQMKPEWIVGTSMRGYGTTLTVGLGVPIPILNEEILKYAAQKDEDIFAPIIDYSKAYPNAEPGNLGTVNYKQLKSGSIKVEGKDVPTGALSSYSKAVEIATILKKEIEQGKFILSKPTQLLPQADSEYKFGPLKERPVKR
ncbi:homocysteine biosynthesis protein [Candidatus Woesearchaeota archaeon]|nr:homocysteine biosynthesis protein [Candidatus Woesearchaeota archaeon]